jgi:hypothetical protein
MRGGFEAYQKWAKSASQYSNVPPNQGGDRVVRTKPLAVGGGTTDSEPLSVRRALILGLLVQPVFYGGAKLIADAGKMNSQELRQRVGYDEGDAVTLPALETQLASAVATGMQSGIEPIIEALEEAGGPQLNAAAGFGRWVIPWVGGWERTWTSLPSDASFLGGPPRASFSEGGRSFSQESARLFVYGPGEGGIVVEYLHAAPGTPSKMLLSRAGTVTNLGSCNFQLDFTQPLLEYEVQRKLSNGPDTLVTGRPFDGGTAQAPPTTELILHTTYLSERLWIVRSVRDPTKISVFTRTETRSVMDRRGLVAEGQLKPPEDESIRYGRLLFGETLEDYTGWGKKEGDAGAVRQKLLGVGDTN